LELVGTRGTHLYMQKAGGGGFLFKTKITAALYLIATTKRVMTFVKSHMVLCLGCYCCFLATQEGWPVGGTLHVWGPVEGSVSDPMENA